MRKPILIVVAIAVVVAAVLFAATPLLMLRHLRIALQTRDTVAVAPLVDFPTLRANAKASAHQKIERKNDGTFLEPVKDWFERHFTDEVLDKVATPAGLVRLTCDHELDADVEKTRGQPCVLNGKLDHFGYQSFDRFKVTIVQADGKPLKLVLGRRHWFDWQLINIMNAGGSS